MVDEVDPRGPRLGQAVTAALALGAVALQEQALVYALAVVLVVPVVSRWRIDPYRFVWTRAGRRLVGPSGAVESAIPHRFARVVGSAFTTVGSALLVAAWASGIGWLATPGYGIVAVVGLLAALGATTGICVGCRMYRQVGVFLDLGLLTSPTPLDR
jgi:hypothetical protein